MQKINIYVLGHHLSNDNHEVAERFIIRNIIKTKNKGGTSLIEFLNLYGFFGLLFRKGIPFALTSYTL